MNSKVVSIYLKNIKCGVLSKLGDDSFEFKYLDEYIQNNGQSISLSLPIALKHFHSTSLFPFFEGLIPEGWLLNLAQKELRLNANKDKFELLVALCQQTIGAVHVGESKRAKSKYSVSSNIKKEFKFQKCLICYEDFSDSAHNNVYHIKCMKDVFSKEIVPYIDLDNNKIEEMAKLSLSEHQTITGVQKKLSLDLNDGEIGGGKGNRLTITDLWGKFILKPKGKAPHLPENEHLSLKLAADFGIEVEKSALIPLSSGELGFIARRFDRGQKNEEYHQEDFCQILKQPSIQKYTGSYEQIGKILKNNSTFPGNDTYRLFEMVIFNFIIGNVDLHLKNFSFCYENSKGMRNFLSPAYDILSTDLYLDDDEQSALAINGKKNKLKVSDFKSLASSIGITEKVYENVVEKAYKTLPTWLQTIEQSFLSIEDQNKYKNLIMKRIDFF